MTRSPFPGMDPYLESHWRDVHATLNTAARAELNRRMAGSAFRARVDERLVVESPADDARSIYPDVRVFEHGSSRPLLMMEPPIAVAEPLVVSAASDLAKHRFIEIIDISSSGQLVTVVEFVSPSNKRTGDGRDKYLKKQREVIDSATNLVEVDLTRSGRREMGYPQANHPLTREATYFVCVYRGFGEDVFELYAMGLRQRLPAIRIPLRPELPDVPLDLQPLIDRAFEEGAYDDIDYGLPSDPPLEGDDAAWADELLRASGRR